MLDDWSPSGLHHHILLLGEVTAVFGDRLRADLQEPIVEFLVVVVDTVLKDFSGEISSENFLDLDCCLYFPEVLLTNADA